MANIHDDEGQMRLHEGPRRHNAFENVATLKRRFQNRSCLFLKSQFKMHAMDLKKQIKEGRSFHTTESAAWDGRIFWTL